MYIYVLTMHVMKLKGIRSQHLFHICSKTVLGKMYRKLTLVQRKDIVKYFYEFKSLIVVRRKFRLKYGIANVPSAKAIKAVVQRFEDTCSVQDRARSGRPKVARSAENIALVEESIVQTPTKSVRRLSSDTGLSRESVRLILVKDLHLKPYKRRIYHELKDVDYPRRVEFCRDLLNVINENPDILSAIMFSDESMFSLDPSTVGYNRHYWSSDDPHFHSEHPLQAPRVIVWCALSSSTIIGPYFFDGSVIGESYLRMLRKYFVPALRRKGSLHDTIFQQDGAAPHTSTENLAWLQNRFPDRLLSYRTPRIWPPRSPDLSPLDFYLWGHVKDQLTEDDLTSIETLKASINTIIRRLSRNHDVLEKVIKSFKFRLESCVLNDGGHVEL